MNKQFMKIVLMIYCADCRIEMPNEDWPRHYRTRLHRKNIHATPPTR